MNIQSYIQTVKNSVGDDWHNTHCWGHGSGPSYKDHFQMNYVYHGQENIILLNSHSNRATYKPDIRISFAWGLTDEFGEERNPKITEAWATVFPDNSGARVAFVDFFYNDSLVFRHTYGSVDGGRCKLPVPHRNSNGDFVASKEYSDVMRVLNAIEGGADYDSYLNRSGIKLIDEPILD
jgi:hypothetical protein